VGVSFLNNSLAHSITPRRVSQSQQLRENNYRSIPTSVYRRKLFCTLHYSTPIFRCNISRVSLTLQHDKVAPSRSVTCTGQPQNVCVVGFQLRFLLLYRTHIGSGHSVFHHLQSYSGNCDANFPS